MSSKEKQNISFILPREGAEPIPSDTSHTSGSSSGSTITKKKCTSNLTLLPSRSESVKKNFTLLL